MNCSGDSLGEFGILIKENELFEFFVLTKRGFVNG